MTDDGKEDHGGDFEVQQHGKRVKVLKGITSDAAAQVAKAMDAEGAFDG